MSIRDKIDNNNVKILVFQGSWCPMCVTAMPQIAQFVSANNISENSIEVINVNSFKTEPADKIAEYNISRVPTVIILKEGVESSRITEYAPNGWRREIEEKVSAI